jgi:hypothetical protein
MWAIESEIISSSITVLLLDRCSRAVLSKLQAHLNGPFIRTVPGEPRMKLAGPKDPLFRKSSDLKLSAVCIACRESHLRCSGGPVCNRSATECTPCVFKRSRRGQRRATVVLEPSGLESPPLPSATCVNCRGRHLKCSGGPACLRCAKDAIPCRFKRSRQGQRKPILRPNIVWTTPKQLPCATPVLRIYALKQQGRGLRLLNDSDQLPSETVIISSILLVCFGALQRGFSSMVNTLRVSFRI